MVNRIEASHLNSSVHISYPRMKSYITIQDFNNILSNINFVTNISDNSKVFFSESAVFPREILRIYGKDKNINTIRDRHKADYIVVGNNKLSDINYTKQKLYSYTREYLDGNVTKIETGFLIGYESVIPDPTTFKDLKFIDDVYVIRDVKESELIISYINTNNSKFINTENLNDQCLSSTVINYEGYCNLTSMLKSSDEAIQNLAISILCSCNKKLSEFYIAKLYLENVNTITKSSKWNTVICKGFKAYAEHKFWKSMYYRYDDIRLIKDFISAKTNIYLSKVHFDHIIDAFKNHIVSNFQNQATFLNVDIEYIYTIKDEERKYLTFEEDSE